ncbi:MAG: hypothetical protein KAR54_02595 [Candidatus Pacebacteria bacterium]|nr:hypothetical protein [Candidatus Paceibacterota bacterium]
MFTITVKYSPVLEAIIGNDFDKFTVDLRVNENVIVPFGFVLYNLENIRPELFKRYPLDTLDFKLNGESPESTALLKDGDIIFVGVGENV